MDRQTLSQCARSAARHLAWTAGAALIFCLLSLAVDPSAVRADGIIIPQPPPDQPVSWREVPLTIKYHRVETQIRDQVATTRVDQVFVNEAPYSVEGVYLFPLPADAAVTGFDMWVDGQRLEGKLLDKEAARAIYEEIVRNQRDPALLEYTGRGVFKASIFPIPPGGERRVQLEYVQLLSQENGLVRYVYPLNTEKFSSRPLQEASVQVRVEEDSPIRAIYSPSHPVEITREGSRQALVTYSEENVTPSEDFVLFYSLSQDGVAASLLTYKPYDEDGFFLLLVTPPMEAEQGTAAEKDVIAVLDVSGSMEGEKLAQAKEALLGVLGQLVPGDRFNVVAFSSGVSSLAREPLGLERLSDGRAFVNRLKAGGSTDINRALLEALGTADRDRPTILVFLTDGLPTMGEVDPLRIADNIRENAPDSVRLFSFGVGYDVDAALMDQLSQEQRGASAYVRPDENIEERVGDFWRRVNTPVLVDLALASQGVLIEDTLPEPLPDLFAGSQLAVLGRYRAGGEGDLMLSGTVNGERRAMVYPGLDFAGSGGDAFIARLWAQRKIGALLTQIRLHGADRELVDEVVALSTRFGIVTPYTSFLVEEPALAIGQEGRQLLADRMAAPAGGPQAAPRAGEAAVMKSVTERSLMDSARAWAAAPEAAARLIHVAEKAFLLQDGVWVDTAFEPTGGIPIEVQFGDSAYFDLLARVPEIGRYLALGQRLVVVFDGVAYRVIANASEAKPVSGQASAATAEVPTAPATGSPDATPSSVLRSGDAGQPAPSPSDALPSCSGTLILLGALALLGTGSTVARRRELD